MAKTKKKTSTVKQEQVESKYYEQKTYETKELISIFGVVATFILIIVGLFTPMIKANGNYVYSFTYFFKFGIDEITKTSSGLGMWLGISHYVVILASWLLAFVSSVLLFAFWIIKIVQFFTQKHSTFDYKKLNRWTIAFVIPYILIVCSTLSGRFPNNIVCNPGYGVFLVLLGLFGILVIDSVNSMDEIKSSLGTFIVDRVLFVFLMTLPFWYISSFSVYNGDTLRYTMSPYCLIDQLLAGDIIKTLNNPILLLSAIFLISISIIFIPLIIRAINNSTKIIFSSVSFGILTLAFILMQIFSKGNGNEILYISTSFYLLYVGVLAVLFLSIALLIQNRPDKIKQN